MSNKAKFTKVFKVSTPTPSCTRPVPTGDLHKVCSLTCLAWDARWNPRLTAATGGALERNPLEGSAGCGLRGCRLRAAGTWATNSVWRAAGCGVYRARCKLG